MKNSKNNRWLHLVMIVIITLIPLRVLTANAEFTASASSIVSHQAELLEMDHENCNMDVGCVTDCQLSSTHCSSASLIIPPNGHVLTTLSSNQLPNFGIGQLQSVSRKNLFRPPRS